jgi:hypothetical protein
MGDVDIKEELGRVQVEFPDGVQAYILALKGNGSVVDENRRKSEYAVVQRKFHVEFVNVDFLQAILFLKAHEELLFISVEQLRLNVCNIISDLNLLLRKNDCGHINQIWKVLFHLFLIFLELPRCLQHRFHSVLYKALADGEAEGSREYGAIGTAS